jgi:hypothetical protein
VAIPYEILAWTASWFGLLERGGVPFATPVGLPPCFALPWDNRLGPVSSSLIEAEHLNLLYSYSFFSPAFHVLRQRLLGYLD